MKKGGTYIWRRAFFAAALLVILLFSALPLSATDAPEHPEVDGGHSICLYDITHDRYIIEQNGADMVNTSTSAKVMTGLIACEMLSDRLDEIVTVTDKMLSEVSGYSLKLVAGEKIKVIDLLYAAICGSYNDAVYILAHHIGGDTQGFADLMNQRAAELGAKATVYTNPLGYPDSAAMITTAYDTLKIAIAASENELYMEICSAVKYTMGVTNKSEARQFYNRNYLVSSNSNADYFDSRCAGMNAGYSGESGGWSIITLIHDDGADYICVLLGGKESEDGSEIYAYEGVNQLTDWVCDTYNNYELFKAGEELGAVDIGRTSISTKAPYVAESDVIVYVPTATNTPISYKFDITPDLKAPLSAGDNIGRVVVTCNGETVGECSLLLKESYEVNYLMLVIEKIGDYTTGRAFIATVVCFAVLLCAVLIHRHTNRYKFSSGKYRRMR